MFDDLLHHNLLGGVWPTKYRMQGCKHRHCKAPKELKNIASCPPTEDPKLVLRAYQVNAAEIERTGGNTIGARVILVDLRHTRAGYLYSAVHL